MTDTLLANQGALVEEPLILGSNDIIEWDNEVDVIVIGFGGGAYSWFVCIGAYNFAIPHPWVHPIAAAEAAIASSEAFFFASLVTAIALGVISTF